MKKILRIGALLLASLMLFSCATSVGIGFTDPAEIDMGHYRNIGIASTVPFEGYLSPTTGYVPTLDDAATLHFGYVFSNYNNGLKDQVASYATQRLVGTLEDSGYFNVKRPKQVDPIVKLSPYQDVRELFARNDIDAVIIPKIDSMAVNEYIYSKSSEKVTVDATGNEKKETVTRYYYETRLSMVYSYVIVDTESERIVARRSFSLQDENVMEVKEPNFSFSISNAFARMIDSVQWDIVNQLVPQERVMYETLMDNKPVVKAIEPAYELVDDGMYSSAYNIFIDEWKRSQNLPSGYNASILLAASGKYDEASALLDDVVSVHPYSRDAQYLKAKLTELKDRNDRGNAQINGENPKEYADRTSDIYGNLMHN